MHEQQQTRLEMESAMESRDGILLPNSLYIFKHEKLLYTYYKPSSLILIFNFSIATIS